MKNFILLTTLFFCWCKMSYGQAGQIDTTFGNNGIVKTDFGFISDKEYETTGRQVWLQPDGKLNVLIEVSGQSYIARRLHNGSPDISYGNNGFSDPIDIQQAVAAVQSDGKIVVAGNDLSYSFAIARYNADGTLDDSFNSTGKQTTDFGSGYNIANAIAIQRDGKIVVAGYAYIEVSSDFAVARYNPDGSPDSSFSTDGKQTADFGSETDFAYSVAIQNDGKIVLAGQSYVQGASDFAVVRYNSNGTLDNTFSTDGKQTTDFNFSEDIGKAVAIQRDGKILIAGIVYKCNDETCTNPEFALVRYNTDGSADNTFNGDGKKVTNFGSGYYTTSLAIQHDNKIVVAGYAYQSDSTDFALARFNADGSPDNTFDADGRLLTDFGTKWDIATSIAIQSDGKIVAVGLDDGLHFDLVRYNTDGRLDNTFSRGGKLIDRLRVNQGSTYFLSTAPQHDGKIVAAGYTWNGSNYDFALARYNADGSLDNDFSNDGRQTTDFNSEDEYAFSVAIQSDGKIVLAGAAGSYFALSRYNADGSLDLSFGNEGKKVTAFGIDRVAVANAVAIQNDGKIVLAGYTYGPLEHSTDFALARFNTDGSPDRTFSEDGKLTTDLGYDDFANNAVIQGDGKIVAAGYSAISVRGESNSFFAITRYNADGTPDHTFSEDGKQFTMFDAFSSVQSLTIQPDGKIVAGGFSSSSSPDGEDFAMARYNTDGSLDIAFGEGGTKVSDFNSGAEYINSTVIQNDGKIIVAGSSNGSFAVARYHADGNIDTGFGENGITVTEASGQEDIIYDVAIVNDKLYAAGYGQSPGNLGIVARYRLDENRASVVSLSIPYNIVKYSSPARIKLNATVIDPDAPIAKVQFYNGSHLLHTEDIFPYGFLWIDIPAGNYTLTAKATDKNGRVTESNSINVSVADSNVSPAVSIVSPLTDTTYNGPASVRLIAKAKDPNDRISKVEFFNGTTLLSTEYYYPYTHTWSNVPPGTYTITAVATDEKGLLATSAPLTIAVKESNELMAGRELSGSNQAGSESALSLKVSPNPAGNTLNIYTKGLQKRPSTISLISPSGVVVKTISVNTLNPIVQLNVSSLTSGVYTIKVTNGEKVLNKQFVKM